MYKVVSSPQVYRDLPRDPAPLITTMAMDINDPLVDGVWKSAKRKCVILSPKRVFKTCPLTDAPSPHSCHFMVTDWDPLPALLFALNSSSTT